MCFNKIPCFVFSIFHAWLVDLSTHTQTHLTALFPGLPRWAGTRKVEPIWILLKHETVSGSGISWARCKSAPHSRQITMPAPHSCFFTGRMPFLPPNQQRQSTEGTSIYPVTEYSFLYLFCENCGQTTVVDNAQGVLYCWWLGLPTVLHICTAQ